MIWGLLHGILQVIEKCFVKVNRSYRILTYILVSLLWVFFRADDMTQAGDIFRGMFMNVNGFSASDVLMHGLNAANIAVLILTLIVMILVDVATYKGKNLIDTLFEMKWPVRWMILYGLIFSIIILGVYGPGYDAARFIYYKF